MPRKLRVEYQSEESFQNEYAQNISKGGIFIPTRHQIEIREPVEIELALAFQDQSVVLPGEVVHCIPAEMAETGAQPGVAIQFLISGDELRSKLEGLAAVSGSTLDERVQGTGRRVAPRFRARTSARVEVDGESIEGHTRNISVSGVLISVPGTPPSVGKNVSVRIAHPTKEDDLRVPGIVARHVETSGPLCIGIHFRVPQARQEEVREFVASVRAVEHSRRLGGINGPIAELGIRSLLTMFGTTAPEGMLTVTQGADEGYITIEHGELRARIGTAIGRDALDAMLSLTSGTFEFEAQADEGLVEGPSIPVSEIEEDVESEPGIADPSYDPSLAAEDEEEPADALALMDLDEIDLDPEPSASEEAEESDYDAVEFDAGVDEDDFDGLDLGDVDLQDQEEADASGSSESERPAEGQDDVFRLDVDDALGDLAFVDEQDEPPGMDPSQLSPDDTLCATGERDRSRLSKTEAAVLDLAEVGLSVGKAIDIIPESDEEIRAAVCSLVDEGLLTLG